MRLVACCLGALLVAGACSAEPDRPGTPTADSGDSGDSGDSDSPAPSAAEITVSRVREIRATSGQVQSVSPNGETLLLSDGGRLCVQQTAGGSPECVAWPRDHEADHAQLVASWLPDGSRVVFFDRMQAALTFEAPVWDLDVGTRTLMRWGDDDTMLLFDVALGTAGEGVAGVGATSDGAAGVALIPESGLPDLLVEMRGDALEWVPGGGGLLLGAGGSSDGGLWAVDPTSGAAELVLGRDPDLLSPHLVAVSSDGRAVLVSYRELAAREFFRPNTSYLGVLDLESGLVSPLKSKGGTDFVGPMAAAFSPDGSAVVYLYHDGDDLDAPMVLAVRPLGSTQERVLTDRISTAAGAPRVDQISRPDPAAVWGDERLVFPMENEALVFDL